MQQNRQHPYFGAVSYDERVNQYDAEIAAPQGKVKVYLALDECEDEEALFALGEQFCKDLPGWLPQVEAYAVQELLDLKNDGWLQEGEPPLSASEFVARMSLCNIGVYPDGSYESWFDDGEMFWGHSILIGGKIGSGPTYADTPG